MDEPVTLSFAAFWTWLYGHAGCILRAGTEDAVVYDDEDFHWAFLSEEPGTVVVQVLKGKHFVSEIFLRPEGVAYVQGTPGDTEGEFLFELITETEKERKAPYFFVLTHGYSESPSPAHSKVH